MPASSSTAPVRPPRLLKPGQLLNIGKNLFAAGASAVLRRPVVVGAPSLVMLEPTTTCQLKCPHCPTGRGELSRPSGSMSLTDFRRIWDSLTPAPTILQLWNQGEPLIHGDTPAIIRHAAESGTRVLLSTNVEPLAKRSLAESVVRSGLHTLILSLDGATADSHAAYRVGGHFDKVRKGVENVVAARRELGTRWPRLQWQFLLFKHNLHERDEVFRLAREWGVDEIAFKTAQLEAFDEAEGQQWLPDDPTLRRYDLKNGRWVLRRKERPFCQRLYSSTVIQWDGTVVPCCFDKDGEFVLGNALADGVPSVWKSGKYQQFRQRVLTGKRPAMCTNCTEGLSRLYAGNTHRVKSS